MTNEMTNERAKSELMQIYMSLSEEKKKALDVAFKAMEQADNIPVMYYPQVDGITPTVVAQADEEWSDKVLMEKALSLQAKINSELLAENTKLKQAQADGEYILKSEAIRVASGYCHPSNIAKELEKLPTVVIPSAEQKWIPVSERLPEDDGLYLVYTEEQPFVCPFEDGVFFIDEVLAWMPLPPCYEPQERSE